MRLEITTEQYGTIRLALCFFEARSKREAATMDDWAAEYARKGDEATADKCRRNAGASRQFEADARELLAFLP